MVQAHELLHRMPREAQPHATAVSDAAEALMVECEQATNADDTERAIIDRLLNSDIALMASSSSTSNELQASLAELDALVGLSNVKQQVHRLVSLHRANAVREEAGHSKVPVGLHLVFTGSPGTGKTTVARIVARIYRSLGLLPNGHLVEVDRSGLVSGFVGQTAIQVREVIDRAKGGVLFIDEAYALSLGGPNDFGREAISTLVKAMEDHREQMAVIVAGYSEPMQDFLGSNAGLRSRFATVVDFPDYSANELLRIFDLLCAEHGIHLEGPVRDRVASHLTPAVNLADAGNARYVRNLFEHTFANMSLRADADGVVDIGEVLAFAVEDVPEGPQERQRLGFA